MRKRPDVCGSAAKITGATLVAYLQQDNPASPKSCLGAAAELSIADIIMNSELFIGAEV